MLPSRYVACDNKKGKFMKEQEASGLLTETGELKETGDSKYIHRNDLYKACFQHDMVYGDSKDLPRNPTSKKHYVIRYLQ